MREIKPGEINHCVECGSEAVMYYNGAEFMIWCTKCKNASYALTQEKVLLEWNALNPESEVKPFTETPKEVTDTLPRLKPCPFCGRFPLYNGDAYSIFCYNDDCKERPQVYCRNEEALVSMWNHLGDGLEADYKECQRETCDGCECAGECENENQMDYDIQGPFKPCAKCGSPVEWEISFSRGDAGFVKCPRCGNGITFNNGDFSSVDEVVEKWNQVNMKPERQTELPSVNWLFNIPDRTAQMLLFKLDVLNSVLGLQRDSDGPVYVVNTIQNDLIEIASHIRDGETWCGLDNVKALEFEIDKMKKDHVLQFPKEESIDVHGSFYVTVLHIARAICREAELYAWDYEQKKGIGKMSEIPEYLNRLGDWLFIKAEYLRETEECC